MDNGAEHTTILKWVSGPDADPDADLGDLAGLLQLWEARRRDGTLPTRGDFDPLDLKKFLGRIVLFDALENPRRFRFRLVGTDWVNRFGLDPTNTLVDDFPRAQSRPFINEVLGQVVDRKMPLWVRRAIVIEGRFFHYGMLLMPLSADGKTVNIVMAGFDLETQAI